MCWLNFSQIRPTFSEVLRRLRRIQNSFRSRRRTGSQSKSYVAPSQFGARMKERKQQRHSLRTKATPTTTTTRNEATVLTTTSTSLPVKAATTATAAVDTIRDTEAVISSDITNTRDHNSARVEVQSPTSAEPTISTESSRTPNNVGTTVTTTKNENQRLLT